MRFSANASSETLKACAFEVEASDSGEAMSLHDSSGWGTGVCQVRRCIARATYLVMETWQNESESGEWWQYCCKDHAQDFAERHGLDVPAASRGAECQTC